MQKTSGGRSNWLGVGFLGLAVALTLLTVFLALTDRSLTDIGILSEGDQSPSDQSTSDASATMTAVATPTPTLAFDPVPEDIELTAGAAFVIQPDIDAVLFERNADQPLQPASTTKIFTAMVVLEYASPEEVIEIIEEDVVDPAVESTMGLLGGDRVTVHDLLVGLMLPSGNDAANALSRTIGARIEGSDEQSSDERFIAEMNRLARDLGLESVELRNPAGLDREEQVVTARELAVAAEALLQRPSLRAIVAMKHAEVSVGGDNARVLTVENTNELLAHEDVHGIKTGTTAEAGQCMVVAYRNGESIVIAVILNSEDRYSDARTLLGLPVPEESDSDSADEVAPEHTEPGESEADPSDQPDSQSNSP